MAAEAPIQDPVPRHGNSKVTRQDWLRAARDVLVSQGVGEVKVLTLSKALGVARSSFYWYFQDHADLLEALLSEWETRNTTCLIEKCRQPAVSIGHAVCHFFECFLDDTLFDQGLDFAVREWSRRDPVIRTKIDAADARRIRAVTEVFVRHGFAPKEADARARILYFMQLGYNALEVREPLSERMGRLEGYLIGFTGQEPAAELLRDFNCRVRALGVAP